MASLNKVCLIGNVTADVDTRYMANGDAVVNLRLATTESWKDKSTGEKKEVTEWHRLVAYRKIAEIITQYVKKGSSLYIEGRIRTRKWQDKDGQDRYTTEIEVTEMQMLGGRRSSGDSDSSGNEQRSSGQQRNSGGGGNGEAPAPQRRAPAPAYDDHDIPFANNQMAFDPTFNRASSRIRRVA